MRYVITYINIIEEKRYHYVIVILNIANNKVYRFKWGKSQWCFVQFIQFKM